MKISPTFVAQALSCALVTLSNQASAWEPGTYPTSPARMWTGDFSVNNADRNDVVAFWHAVYQASEGYENRIKWSGNYSGNNGTVSGAFLDDVERRVNYFRAMCGLSSDTSVSTDSTVVINSEDVFKPSSNTPKATAAQNAALMLVRNYNPTTGAAPALTHYPPSNLLGWSAAAWNANSKGNFAFGLYGPGAITEYMIEQLSKSATTSSWNSLVGHRRWNLYPGATTFATGDQPGTSATRPPSNVFYVVQKDSEIAVGTAEEFVAYPPAGFFPAPINSPYWSLSRAGADFSSATVTMTNASGSSVPIVSTQRNDSYGDPAIVWQVHSSASVQQVSKDTTFNVTVSGIVGDHVPSSYSYSVTLIDPNLITSNQNLYGASKVTSKAKEIYTFTPPPGAEGVKVLAYKRSSAAWKENAESTTKSRVVDGTAASYPLLVKPASFPGFGGIAGSYSFHLTFPTSYDLIKRGIPDQTFELGRDFLCGSKSKLTFKYRRGYMTKGSYLAVEISRNDGVTWTPIGSTIRGVSDTKFDNVVTNASYSLPSSSYPTRVRFRYYTKGGSIYTHEAAPKSPTGIFIDEITSSGCNVWVLEKTNTYPSSRTNFAFSSGTAGETLAKGDRWQLRLSTKLGGKWLPQGKAKPVTITSP